MLEKPPVTPHFVSVASLKMRPMELADALKGERTKVKKLEEKLAKQRAEGALAAVCKLQATLIGEEGRSQLLQEATERCSRLKERGLTTNFLSC